MIRAAQMCGPGVIRGGSSTGICACDSYKSSIVANLSNKSSTKVGAEVIKASEMLVAPRISEYFLKFLNFKIWKFEKFGKF